MELCSGVIWKLSPVCFRSVVTRILLSEQSCPHGGVGAHVLVFVPPQLMLQREFGRAQAVQPPRSLPLSLSPRSISSLHHT